MKRKTNKKSVFSANISFGGVSLTQKALLAKHLSVMLRSGLPITEALEVAEESTQGRLKNILNRVLSSVRSGRSLSDSFSDYPKVFSGLFINATRAGEASGTLAENLENVSIQLGKERELFSKIKGAMIYPIIILAATFILGMVLSFVILPKITPLFEGLNVELPLTTRGLIKFSNFVSNYGIELFIGIIGGALFILWLFRRSFMHPFTHLLILKTPVIKGISKNANMAKTFNMLGVLLKSGVQIDEAIEITEGASSNYYYRRALQKIGQDVRKGKKLAESLGKFSALFPLLSTRMIRVGEESGRFEETFLYLAGFYEAEVDDATKTLSVAIEPILLLIIGLVVAFLALSIITPIYDITGNIRR